MKEIKKVIEETLPDSGKPVASYKLTYNSKDNQIEPIYYWILDFIQDMRWKVEKVTDNFMTSPGSGQFLEFSQRITRLQDEGMKILGSVNQVIKSILNLIYDLREFEQRLKTYDLSNSDVPKERIEGLLGLKQIWLDSVDIKRNRGSIHAMANEAGFTTLREAFMLANTQEELKKMNDDKENNFGWINDSVYRILVPRLNDFFVWKDYSEKELRKRMKIEKNYLKSQVETLKLYSSWVKPYLKAAEELRQQGFEGNAALVHAFSTTMFELTLLGKKEASVPKPHGDYTPKRKYHQVILISMKYRGHVSQRVTQRGDYGFAAGGRLDMAFDAYVLNDDELALVNKKRAEDDVSDLYKFSFDVAEEALKEIREDLDHFLNDDKDKKEDEKKKKEKKQEDDLNPFSALFSLFSDFFKKREKKKEKKEIHSASDIAKDDFVESAMRQTAAKDVSDGIYTIYDVYKKSHGHASAEGQFDNAVVK